MHHYLPSVVIALSLMVAPAFAADPQETYAAGINQLYNLDFPEAEATFGSLTREYPKNPDYWNALASTYWLKILYDQQKLNLESFGAKKRFGTGDSKDAVSKEEEQRLRDTVQKAMDLSDAMLKKDSDDIHALYAKAASYATLASFEATIKRSWLSAARKAKTARDLDKKVLKLDPNFNDARTSVGIYNYAVGSLSWTARLLVSIVGLGGDGKEAGIRDLELAAAKGKRATTDAKMLLIVVYGREEEWDKALSLIDEMHRKYPRNFMLDMTKASLYGKMKRWDLAERTYKQTLEKIRAHTDGYDRMRIEKVYYELANSQFQAQKWEEATRTYALVTKGPDATPNEKANAHLWMGRMADTRSDREEALRHYNAILELDVDKGIKSDAKDNIKQPFGSR